MGGCVCMLMSLHYLSGNMHYLITSYQCLLKYAYCTLLFFYFVFVSLQDVPEVDQVLPWVVSTLEKIDLPKLEKELPGSYRHRLSAPAQNWWAGFLQQMPLTYETVSNTIKNVKTTHSQFFFFFYFLCSV